MNPLIRCAIYTRCPCGEEHAARREGERLVRLHAGEGWVALARRYDDPGASGRSLLWPGLAQLIRDIADCRVDCVVVRDATRLTRNSAEFVEMCNYFAKYGVKLAFCGLPTEPAGASK